MRNGKNNRIICCLTSILTTESGSKGDVAVGKSLCFAFWHLVFVYLWKLIICNNDDILQSLISDDIPGTPTLDSRWYCLFVSLWALCFPDFHSFS